MYRAFVGNVIFQSTLPLRGATPSFWPGPGPWRYFNPHSPCGERLLDRAHQLRQVLISIHTPLAGSDFAIKRGQQSIFRFQSTLPLRGATSPSNAVSKASSDFNPHSPCGERLSAIPPEASPTNFNPHSPCGERPYVRVLTSWGLAISIHTPLAGSDHDPIRGRCRIQISIHTPLAGSDLPDV